MGVVVLSLLPLSPTNYPATEVTVVSTAFSKPMLKPGGVVVVNADTALTLRGRSVRPLAAHS